MKHSIPNPDCGCVIHPNQTHEEHMDQLDREMNRETLEKAVKEGRVTPALWNWFCNAEMLRLQDKERNMKLGKIREVVLAYKPKPKTKAAKRRIRRDKRKAKNVAK